MKLNGICTVLHRMKLSWCALKIYNYFNLTQMKILRAKLFCRHLFWMVIWFLALHMEDLSWGLATIFMCPNVLWGWIFKAGLLSFCRCIFLSLQLTLPSIWHLEGGKQELTVGTQKWETLLQVCFWGWEESSQLCSPTEGFGIELCALFSCIMLKWGVCWHGPDL